MTLNAALATPQRVARNKEYPEQLRLPLAEGMTAKIDAVLHDGEPRLTMLRDAIEREIKRRQRELSRRESK